MKRTVLVLIAMLAVAGLGTALSQTGNQNAKDIPKDVLSVFKKNCVRCHTGPMPPRGLKFIPNKIAAAIDAPSAEVPSLKIINSDDPDASYLLKKVRRGTDIQGKPMPPGKALKPEDVQTLADWIAGLK